MGISYLDVTGAESGLEPPFSQMSSMENELYMAHTALVKVGFCHVKCVSISNHL